MHARYWFDEVRGSRRTMELDQALIIFAVLESTNDTCLHRHPLTIPCAAWFFLAINVLWGFFSVYTLGQRQVRVDESGVFAVEGIWR